MRIRNEKCRDTVPMMILVYAGCAVLYVAVLSAAVLPAVMLTWLWLWLWLRLQLRHTNFASAGSKSRVESPRVCLGNSRLPG